MDNKNPLVTFITVVYNGVSELEATIKSILSQTDKRFEYFIIDGGSTDGTLELIKKYESKLTGWISEKDNGLYDAMNKSVKMAHGNYLWFMNAGDLVYSDDTLEKIFSFLKTGDEGRGTGDEGRGTKDEGRGTKDERRGTRDERRGTRDERREMGNTTSEVKDQKQETGGTQKEKSKQSNGLIVQSSDGHINLTEIPDVIYGETEIIDESGNSIGLRRLKAPEQLNWKSLQWGMVVCHQSFLVKREKFLPYNLDYRLAADIDWMIRVLKQCNNTFNTKRILSKFKAGGLSQENIRPGLKERFRIMKKNYGTVTTLFNHVVLGTKFILYVLRNRRI